MVADHHKCLLVHVAASDDGIDTGQTLQLEPEFDPEAKDPPEISDDYLLRQFVKYNIKPGQVKRLGVYLNVKQYQVDQAARDHPTDPAMQAVCVWNEWKKSQPESSNNCYAYGKLQFVLRQVGLGAVVKHIDPKKTGILSRCKFLLEATG